MTQTTFFDDPLIKGALDVFKNSLETNPVALSALNTKEFSKPANFTLRPYQTECIDSVLSSWEEYQRVLAVLPTGAGKTVIFSKVTERSLPGRTLILAHREELIQQACDKIKSVTGIEAEIEKAEKVAHRWANVVVASVQTLQGDRLEGWPQDHFARIVVDEAHHALSPSYRNVLDWFAPARVLGVTATPFRGDKKNLGALFETIAFEVGLIDLIKKGYLAPIKIKSIPLSIDLNNVKTTTGDFDLDQVDAAIAPVLAGAAEAISKEAANRKVLVFLPLRKTSIAFAAMLNAMGIRAAHVAGDSEDRAEILSDFSKGKYQVLCNAMLLTEGYDEPFVDCIVILRPTKSQPLYAQMVGRGTRLAQGKSDCLLLDFLWLHEKHSLIRPAHLVAGSTEEAEYITRELKKAGGSSMDLLDAQKAATNEREEALRKAVEAHQRKKQKTISIEELALYLHNPDIANYEASIGSDDVPPTDKQTELLLRWKIDTQEIKTKLQASAIIDRMISRQNLKLATPNQIKYLSRYGIKNGDQWSFQRANDFLTRKWGK